MVDLGSAYFQLTPSLEGFSGTVSRQLGGIGAVAGKKSGAGFTGAFKGALAPLAGIAAATIGISAVTGFISDSVSAASDLQQSVGGVDAVFGKSADSIHDWAKEGAKSVGLSENAYNGLASVIGSQLKNAGESMDKVAGKTKSLIETGADLSATFGGTAAEAVEAISSALRGERDPIEKYGVSLNQAAVDAEAARLGFTKVGGALSTQGSQAATLSLIYKQTSSATGQFAAQTDTLAEKQQIFGAQMENVKAKVGEAFLPAISDMLGALSGALPGALTAIKPLLDGFATKAAEAGTAISQFFKGVSGADAAAPAFMTGKGGLTGAPLNNNILSGQELAKQGPAIQAAMDKISKSISDALPSLTLAAKDLFPALASVLLALLPIVPPLAGALSALAPVITVLSGALTGFVQFAVIPIINNIAGFIGFFTQLASGGLTASLRMDALSGSFGPVIRALGTFGQFVGETLGTAIRLFTRLPGQVIAGLGDTKHTLFESGSAIVQGFIDGIMANFESAKRAASGLMQAVRDFFPNSPAKTGPFSGRGWTQIGKSGGALASQFTGGFNAGITNFGANASRMIPDTISSNIRGTITNTSKAPSTSVLIANKTNVRLEDLVDVRIARSDEESSRAQRLGYQPLVFG